MSKRNIVHVEIPTKDGAASGKFYADLFGWKVQTDEKMDYTMWEPAEGPGGGFNPVTEEYPVSTIMIYIDSEDIEADLQKAKSLGGKIATPKTEIPTIGWFGVFEDPTGNKIALYTSMNPE